MADAGPRPHTLPPRRRSSTCSSARSAISTWRPTYRSGQVRGRAGVRQPRGSARGAVGFGGCQHRAPGKARARWKGAGIRRRATGSLHRRHPRLRQGGRTRCWRPTRSRSALTAVELGVPAALVDGPGARLRLAAATRTDVARLERLLRALRATRIVTCDDDGRWSLTADGRALAPTAPGDEETLAAYADHVRTGSFPAWAGLADVIRGAEPPSYPVDEMCGPLDLGGNRGARAPWTPSSDRSPSPPALGSLTSGAVSVRSPRPSCPQARHHLRAGRAAGDGGTGKARLGDRARIARRGHPVRGSAPAGTPGRSLPAREGHRHARRRCGDRPAALPAARSVATGRVEVVDLEADGTPAAAFGDLLNLARSGGGVRSPEQWRELGRRTGLRLAARRSITAPFVHLSFEPVRGARAATDRGGERTMTSRTWRARPSKPRRDRPRRPSGSGRSAARPIRSNTSTTSSTIRRGASGSECLGLAILLGAGVVWSAVAKRGHHGPAPAWSCRREGVFTGRGTSRPGWSSQVRVSEDDVVSEGQELAVVEEPGSGREVSVRSPIAGTVVSIEVRAGDVSQPGSPMFRIAPLQGELVAVGLFPAAGIAPALRRSGRPRSPSTASPRTGTARWSGESTRSARSRRPTSVSAAHRRLHRCSRSSQQLGPLREVGIAADTGRHAVRDRLDAAGRGRQRHCRSGSGPSSPVTVGRQTLIEQGLRLTDDRRRSAARASPVRSLTRQDPDGPADAGHRVRRSLAGHGARPLRPVGAAGRAARAQRRLARRDHACPTWSRRPSRSAWSARATCAARACCPSSAIR